MGCWDRETVRSAACGVRLNPSASPVHSVQRAGATPGASVARSSGSCTTNPDCAPRTPYQLLVESVADGEAPLVHQLSVREQERLDATARRLFAFLSAS